MVPSIMATFPCVSISLPLCMLSHVTLNNDLLIIFGAFGVNKTLSVIVNQTEYNRKDLLNTNRR